MRKVRPALPLQQAACSPHPRRRGSATSSPIIPTVFLPPPTPPWERRPRPPATAVGKAGIGRAINGGFGMVLDGSERVDTILRMSMPWDTMVGVARRSWARNENAMTTAEEYNRLAAGETRITLPVLAEDELVLAAVRAAEGKA